MRRPCQDEKGPKANVIEGLLLQLTTQGGSAPAEKNRCELQSSLGKIDGIAQALTPHK